MVVVNVSDGCFVIDRKNFADVLQLLHEFIEDRLGLVNGLSFFVSFKDFVQGRIHTSSASNGSLVIVACNAYFYLALNGQRRQMRTLIEELKGR